MKRISIDTDNLVKLYLSGISQFELGKIFNVSRTVVHRRLIENGIVIRNIPDAAVIRDAKIPIEVKRQRFIKAQQACIGRIVTEREKTLRANSRQSSCKQSASEILFCDWLTQRGYKIIPQQAIGFYNVDIGIFPIAIEILGGSWHASKPIHAERTRYILNKGWSMIFIWVNGRRSPLVSSVTDYVISRLEFLRQNPSIVSQYWVIRGDGKELSTGSIDSDNISIVVPGYESLNRVSRN